MENNDMVTLYVRHHSPVYIKKERRKKVAGEGTTVYSVNVYGITGTNLFSYKWIKSAMSFFNQ